MTRLRIFRDLAAMLVVLAGVYTAGVIFSDLVAEGQPGMWGWAQHNRTVTTMKLIWAAVAAAIGGISFFWKEGEMQKARLAGLRSHYVGFGKATGLILLVFFAAGCATTYDPRPGVVYMPPREVPAGQPQVGVPQYLEVLRGRSICFTYLPNEMVTTAQDYFRAAGAVVVYDCYRAHFRLYSQYNTEYVSSGGLFGTVNGVSLVHDRRLVMRLTLTTQNSAGIEQLVFSGSAAALYSSGYGYETAIRSAGRAALINLH